MSYNIFFILQKTLLTASSADREIDFRFIIYSDYLLHALYY